MGRVLFKKYRVNEEIPYEELDKHFTRPKNLGVKKKFKLPRKIKKRLGECPIFNDMSDPYISSAVTYGDTLEKKLAYHGWKVNPNYKRFLIKCVCMDNAGMTKLIDNVTRGITPDELMGLLDKTGYPSNDVWEIFYSIKNRSDLEEFKKKLNVSKSES